MKLLRVHLSWSDLVTRELRAALTVRAGAEAAAVVKVAEMNRRMVSGLSVLVGMCHAQGVSGNVCWL